MNNRNYNTYFHTHTISGIIICMVLYVIFFAGSFSFFKAEIAAWQQGESFDTHGQAGFPYAYVLDSLDKQHDLRGRELYLYFYPNSLNTYVYMGPSLDTLRNKQAGESTYFYYNLADKQGRSYEDAYDLGEFLYRLHFLAQLNYVPIPVGYPFGYVLAGLVSFLFLFALITGLLLHWDKIVSNFFLFRPWTKLKTLWTDLHTVLGVIGFPYQLVYAITGIILIVNTVYTAPIAHLLYGGDEEKVYQDLGFEVAVDAEFANKPAAALPDIQRLIEQTQREWTGAALRRMTIKHYGDEHMQLVLQVEADPSRSFSGAGYVVYDVHGKVVKQQSPIGETTYADVMRSVVYRLHYGDYGGLFLKIAYFILGIMGCLIIVSGIVIWLVARDKNNIPLHKRRFNFWLANIFLAVCLSMFPVTAFTFVVVKASAVVNEMLIYQTYFYSWLVLSVYYVIRHDLGRTNRETLLLGAVLSVLVPLANGLYAGNWPWLTWAAGEVDIFFLDMFWMVLAIVTFVGYGKVKGRGV
ncbi:PepSY-associated TM helix domain-containing protein [Parapedobacter koreensis]|uniref:Uncharacterized iron-regulated membrane protein n=1 Tax=Parapedobacter koreensis TaxID=332977 RepID=A0A1H7NRU4_9SPHI|nr:PepSY-associated TM helix domain-containing protein [Parapedobacter koreensis]SEL26232.1 Uncharacterized iron-regulated membrane protein [Parapedobacter koreensis]